MLNNKTPPKKSLSKVTPKSFGPHPRQHDRYSTITICQELLSEISANVVEPINSRHLHDPIPPSAICGAIQTNNHLKNPEISMLVTAGDFPNEETYEASVALKELFGNSGLKVELTDYSPDKHQRITLSTQSWTKMLDQLQAVKEMQREPQKPADATPRSFD